MAAVVRSTAGACSRRPPPAKCPRRVENAFSLNLTRGRGWKSTKNVVHEQTRENKILICKLESMFLLLPVPRSRRNTAVSAITAVGAGHGSSAPPPPATAAPSQNSFHPASATPSASREVQPAVGGQ